MATVRSSPVKICTGLLVNGIRYSFGDEIVASTDVKIEPYWVNTPETPFASTNLKLSNSGSADATFTFASEGETGTIVSWRFLALHSVTFPGFAVNGVSFPLINSVTDYDKGYRVIHSVEGLKRGSW